MLIVSIVQNLHFGRSHSYNLNNLKSYEVNHSIGDSCFQIEKVGKKFGSYGKTSYLCSVRTSVLAIRVESRERQDLIDTASEQDITDPSCEGWFLLFICLSEKCEEFRFKS